MAQPHKEPSPSSERRSFLTRLHGGAAVLAALVLGGTADAQEKTTAASRTQPLHHEKDDWLDQLPSKHRVVFDTTKAEGLGEALLFAGNFLRVNKSDYGLQNGDLGVLIVVRHRSAALGYNDAMWAKYSANLGTFTAYEDPKSKGAPKANPFNAVDPDASGPNRGVTLESLAKQGVQFGVCASATRAIAGMIAKATGGNTDTIFGDLTSNLVTNARMVPAGVVAVTRAQERGYSLVST